MERYDCSSVPDSEKEERGEQDHELDTYLSCRGFEQAYKTGEYIHSELVKLGIEDAKVTFLSSPYTRCLQTAAGVHKGLTANAKSMKVGGTVTIREQLSEVSMYPNVHDEDPHP